MKYGCIGEHLKHSFSKEIHNLLSDYEYEIREIERDRLDDFMTRRDFRAINVTIPYKEAVIPHMHYIDEHAKSIGAVNTVVNHGGLLYGYNTDFYGITMLARHSGVTLKGKKVVILGTGGTSKTALAVAKAQGAKEILRVSRTSKEDAISYEELYKFHTDAEVIINTTPSGMFPSIFDAPIDLDKFSNLAGLLDTIYNPLSTPLVLKARARKIPAEGGLYMLVAQAVRASEIFLDTKYDDGETDRVYSRIVKDKENVVLIGMPASGKSTVGALLAKGLGKALVDTDALIAERTGMPIPEIFEKLGEKAFRDIESEVIAECAAKNGCIIATGGGAILRPENTNALSENGRIYFIDRPLDALIPTPDRPLSSTKEDIVKRYKERYGIYRDSAHVIIDADCDAMSVAEKIEGDFLKI